MWRSYVRRRAKADAALRAMLGELQQIEHGTPSSHIGVVVASATELVGRRFTAVGERIGNDIRPLILNLAGTGNSPVQSPS